MNHIDFCVITSSFVFGIQTVVPTRLCNCLSSKNATHLKASALLNPLPRNNSLFIPSDTETRSQTADAARRSVPHIGTRELTNRAHFTREESETRTSESAH